MREINCIEIGLVSGGMSTETKVIMAGAAISPVIGVMVALGYFANNQC